MKKILKVYFGRLYYFDDKLKITLQIHSILPETKIIFHQKLIRYFNVCVLTSITTSTTLHVSHSLDNI